MPLYRVTAEKLENVPRTTFEAESLLERKDLQRLLRRDLSPIGADLMLIAEEFGEWEDSNRRIDLLCLSRDSSLVVVEIKRTNDGGHMELQAVRYAAMVSSLTLDQLIPIFARYSGRDPETARGEILSFLRRSDQTDVELTGEVRMVLVSADFSTELTTAVLWLNRHDLDITCIRLRPYRSGSEVLIDATQIIPLPEAAEYEVKLREQEKEKRKATGVRQNILREFWTHFINRSRGRTSLLANRAPTTDAWISGGIGKSGFELNTVLTQQGGRVECYIRLGPERGKGVFKALLARKEEIERAYGGPLDWQEIVGQKGCRISSPELPGGWRSDEAEWPAIQERLLDALVRLEAALKKPVQELRY